MPNRNKAHINIRQTKTVNRSFSFADQFHSSNSRQIERHITYTDFFKDIVFRKNDSWKMEVLYEFLVRGIKKLIYDSQISNP